MNLADFLNQFDLGKITEKVISFIKNSFIYPYEYIKQLPPEIQISLKIGLILTISITTALLLYFIIKHRKAYLYVKY